MDNPLPDYVEDIATKKSESYNWNQQNVIGSPIRIRTRGGDANSNQWPGYRSGKNKNGDGMNVINELLSPTTIGAGQRYDTLIITERHDLISSLQWENTLGYARHFHDRFIAGNSQGRTFLYHPWLDINKNDPANFIAHEKNALQGWECIASKINHTLEADNRTDRLRVLPAGGALVDLVERAIANQVPGISGTTAQKMNLIFSDNVHLTNLGAYYIALVTYSSVFGKAPSGITAHADTGLSAATTQALQTIAWNYVNSYYSQANPGVRTMAQCRTHFAQNLCTTYHIQVGRTNETQNCINWYSNANNDNGMRWPDPAWTKLPAP